MPVLAGAGAQRLVDRSVDWFDGGVRQLPVEPYRGTGDPNR